MSSAAIKIAGQLRPSCLKLPIQSSRVLLLRTYATESPLRPFIPLNLPDLDQKWRGRWRRALNFEEQSVRRQNNNNPILNPRQPKSNGGTKYILPMFPYPSGTLHMGHLRVYTIADVVARFHRMQGSEVILPMGWDAFGLPAENAAIDRGIEPQKWTIDNIYRMKKQIEAMNGSFDWAREFATCEPSYYKHTQKIFLLLYRHGLAIRKEAPVNWDPIDRTVLANEQVDAQGRSWRSGAKVQKIEMKQWFFRVTKFREALLRDLEQLSKNNNWPENVIAMQENWLGRSNAARYSFPITRENAYPADRQPARSDGKHKIKPLLKVEVYTTRPETIYAVQYIALARDAPLVLSLAERDPKLAAWLRSTEDLPPESTEGYKLEDTSTYNPVYCQNGEVSEDSQLPVYVASYVRGDYKSGAIMGVPAHDARDFAFWKRHNPDKPLKFAVTPDREGCDPVDQDQPFLGSGYMTGLAGQHRAQPSKTVAETVAAEVRSTFGVAQDFQNWKIRDWLISRQRYWGTPIPIIHCWSCGPQPVPEDDLPVTLPDVHKHWQDGKLGNPLEEAHEWLHTPCPKCHRLAKRETDTMDTFVDSSWYYMRFAEPNNLDMPVSETAANSVLPVDIYIGGVEHAILHLLYARFMYKALTAILYPNLSMPVDEIGLPDKEASSVSGPSVTNSFAEPFKKLVTQGMVHGKTYSDPDSGRFLKRTELDLSDPKKPIILDTGKQANVSFEKMSKSKYNGVDPIDCIEEHGADAVRAHVLFQAPVGEVLLWDDSKISGITRWLNRVYHHVYSLAGTGMSGKVSALDFDAVRWFSKSSYTRDGLAKQDPVRVKADMNVWRATQESIMSVTKAYKNVYSLNTVVSTLMSLTNTIVSNPEASTVVRCAATSRLLRMMAPITPAFCEECWSILHDDKCRGIFQYLRFGWPKPDNSLRLLQPDTHESAIMINGKLRCVVEMPLKPGGMVGNSQEHKSWLIEEILKIPEASIKLADPRYDIRSARRVIVVRDGAIVNFVLPDVQD
ncbi:leucyl-tRNA synthetase [Camillea tinctor]|nr:leucyl-tRNA synthetase [Camillea tinctor]